MNSFKIKRILNITNHIDTNAAETSIRGNIYFRGPNAWILAFSVIIASVGLNINSIPVIIGAMLISPLMGPIFGLGLGMGIRDMELMKDSAKNLLIMVIISLIASILYFLITPLQLNNPTELLARTNPTIYDVLIALFGGFAGIFEQCRKEKGTVFAGVAIATALMPPLCTAGFGIASGNLHYFVGALYLFCINSIFIALATYFTVRYLKFREKEFEDKKKGVRTQRLITLIIILFIVPSILSAITMVRQTNFEQRAIAFVEANRTLGKSIIYNHNINHTDGSKVEILFTGERLSDVDRQNLYESAKTFNLDEDQIVINEHTTGDRNDSRELIKTIYERSDVKIHQLTSEIDSLNSELHYYTSTQIPYEQVTKELVATYPQVTELLLSKGSNIIVDNYQNNKCVVAIVKSDSIIDKETSQRIINWLKVRLDIEDLRFYAVDSESIHQ